MAAMERPQRRQPILDGTMIFYVYVLVVEGRGIKFVYMGHFGNKSTPFHLNNSEPWQQVCCCVVGE
ncbi:hypothetical protein SLEP1_g29883 [Rubroshorea leprosula]|uniref:Uncharacterized protein n=1 Tax=Rubroshorea leprosula TaxID=152421 RepID=A0AAV5K7A9_9ROSI|nr:hypothetical protein SLEP1_g29883 [Rubroshorea leprosula]